MKLNRKPSLTLLADCIPSPCSRTLQTHTLNTGGAEQAVSLNHGPRCAPNCGHKPWILMPRCESLRPGEIYEACVRMHVCARTWCSAGDKRIHTASSINLPTLMMALSAVYLWRGWHQNKAVAILDSHDGGQIALSLLPTCEGRLGIGIP